MSEAAPVPFTETKAPESAERLHRGALSLIDISASTMANIGPAYSFYFGFGFLVFTAGVASPLTIIAAGGGGRTARQHAVRVLPRPAVHGRVHLRRGQDLRRDPRGGHAAALRRRVHHPDLVRARELRRRLVR